MTPTDADVEAMMKFLAWLNETRELLPVAELGPWRSPVQAAAVRVGERHPCFRCGKPATWVFRVQPVGAGGEVDRWFDLCEGCVVLLNEVERRVLDRPWDRLP